MRESSAFVTQCPAVHTVDASTIAPVPLAPPCCTAATNGACAMVTTGPPTMRGAAARAPGAQAPTTDARTGIPASFPEFMAGSSSPAPGLERVTSPARRSWRPAARVWWSTALNSETDAGEQLVSGIAILGASGGLGEAIARKLAERTPVTIGYFSKEEKAKEVTDAIAAAGGTATAINVDMTDNASVKAFIAESDDVLGGLDHIVSATGPAIPLCALEDVSHEDFKRIFDTDVYGSFNVLAEGVPVLKERGGGSIILFLTTAVLRTLENDGMSGIPKTAVSGLLRQAAREAGPHNVRVNGIAPGIIDAGIVHDSFTVDAVAQSVIESCFAQTPLGRWGRPEEIAATVDFLTSEGAAYISGQVLAVDGGYSA